MAQPNLTYAEKLKDPRWQKRRLEILQRDNWSCSLCGGGKSTLSVHHIEYHHEPWEAPDEHLTTVCEHCHKSVQAYKIKASHILSDGNSCGALELAIDMISGDRSDSAIRLLHRMAYDSDFFNHLCELDRLLETELFNGFKRGASRNKEAA